MFCPENLELLVLIFGVSIGDRSTQSGTSSSSGRSTNSCGIGPIVTKSYEAFSHLVKTAASGNTLNVTLYNGHLPLHFKTIVPSEEVNLMTSLGNICSLIVSPHLLGTTRQKAMKVSIPRNRYILTGRGT